MGQQLRDPAVQQRGQPRERVLQVGLRIGGRVRQITVPKLGRNSAVKQDDCPVPCSRIAQLSSSYKAPGITVAAEN